jgi:hypothetical protein
MPGSCSACSTWGSLELQCPAATSCCWWPATAPGPDGAAAGYLKTASKPPAPAKTMSGSGQANLELLKPGTAAAGGDWLAG